MKPVQLLLHVDCNDISKFQRLFNEGGALYEALHYTGEGDWYSQVYDLDTVDDVYNMSFLQKVIRQDVRGIKYYTEIEPCEIKVISK